jgi:hypothetical protein
MHPAALPGRTSADCADRVDQAAVGIGDDQLDAVQTAVTQATQERGPEVLVLAVADVVAALDMAARNYPLTAECIFHSDYAESCVKPQIVGMACAAGVA